MKKVLVYALIAIPMMLFACSSGDQDSTSTMADEATNGAVKMTATPTAPQDQGKESGSTAEDIHNSSTQPDEEKPAKEYPAKPVELTTAEFKKLVYDMDKNPKEWVYNGDLPAIVDFYAVWCGPCKMAAPGLEELAKEYSGKVYIYKVDAEKERALSNYFRVTGYPSFLLIPAKGQPRMFAGLPPGVRSQGDIKPAFKKIIDNELLK